MEYLHFDPEKERNLPGHEEYKVEKDYEIEIKYVKNNKCVFFSPC